MVIICVTCDGVIKLARVNFIICEGGMGNLSFVTSVETMEKADTEKLRRRRMTEQRD